MISNAQSISLIKANKQISLYCPIGEDYYTADIEMRLCPDKHYMDYIDLDVFLKGLSGANLTIEDAVDTIYQELQKYKPFKTKVTIKAFSNTHLDVAVSKGDDI